MLRSKHGKYVTELSPSKAKEVDTFEIKIKMGLKATRGKKDHLPFIGTVFLRVEQLDAKSIASIITQELENVQDISTILILLDKLYN